MPLPLLDLPSFPFLPPSDVPFPFFNRRSSAPVRISSVWSLASTFRKRRLLGLFFFLLPFFFSPFVPILPFFLLFMPLPSPDLPSFLPFDMLFMPLPSSDVSFFSFLPFDMPPPSFFMP